MAPTEHGAPGAPCSDDTGAHGAASSQRVRCVTKVRGRVWILRVHRDVCTHWHFKEINIPRLD